MARVSVVTRLRIGSTKAPWPVTILNGRPFSVCRAPLMSMASSGAGTCQPNMMIPPCEEAIFAPAVNL